MDISTTIAPDSTQVNADDVLGNPITVTITDVTKGSADQPVNIHLAEIPDRVYRPGKSMRRVLVAVWGTDSSAYIGRRMTLYCDPSITFGRDRVGGLRISHMSGIDKPVTVNLTVSRGKRAPHTVDPLPDATPEPTAEQVAECADVDTLRALWQHCRTDARRDQIKARVAELTATS